MAIAEMDDVVASTMLISKTMLRIEYSVSGPILRLHVSLRPWADTRPSKPPDSLLCR